VGLFTSSERLARNRAGFTVMTFGRTTLRALVRALVRALGVLIGTMAAAAGNFVGPQTRPSPQTWIATWGASPQPADPDPSEPLLNIDDQTVRERVRVSVGGAQIRLRLSNEHGATPLTIGSASVALSIDATSVRSGSIKSLTFGGSPSVTIPSGAPALSDPVALPVDPGTEISISLYFPGRIATPTLHVLALKHAIVTPHGDFTASDKVQQQSISESSILVTQVLVAARPPQRVVVAFGDSLTDGDASSVDADRSWPSDLARRLVGRAVGPEISVVNEGIIGNRLLADGFGFSIFGLSGLARFDRDALGVTGATHIVVMEGLNDIGFPGAKLGQDLAPDSETRSAEDLIGAYRQLIARAHLRGVKVIGATLTPFEGAQIQGYYSKEKEAKRQEINTWIRRKGNFDAVIDFDAILRDPDHPSRLLERYVSPDHLHPNDAGYQAMADAINPALFL
jgi:lysophospholipase L1-like esterase